jgi:autotransporter-associated beta strand protein
MNSIRRAALSNAFKGAFFAGIFSLSCATAHAATYTWAGGAANWSGSTAWSPSGTTPTGTDAIIFNGTGTNWGTVQFSGPGAASSITVASTETGTTLFVAPGSAFNRNLIIGTGGISIAAGAGQVTIGTTVVNNGVNALLGGSQTWTNNSANALILDNGVYASGLSSTLTLAGSGGYIFNGVIQNNPSGSYTTALVVNTTGSSVVLNGINTYTGATTILSGELDLYGALGVSGSYSTAISTAGILTESSTATITGTSTSLAVTGGTTTLNGSNTYAGATTVGSGGTLILSGTLGLTGSFGTAITTAGTFTENSTGAITGTSSLSVTGGTTTLGGNNSYSGQTSVSGGTLIIGTAASSTMTGTTTVSSGALQLQNVNALQYSPLVLTGGTLQLRSNTSGTFISGSNPITVGTTSTTGTVGFDVGNLGSGTGNTLTLAGALNLGLNSNLQLNVTGTNGYTLNLGAITANTNNGSYVNHVDIIDATTANVNIASFKGGSYGSTLLLEGGGNVTFGSPTSGTTTTISTNSNGTTSVVVAGAVVTIYGSYANGGSGSSYLTLNSGQLNIDSATATPTNASSSTFTINGGLLDNTTGSALATTNSAPINITNSFAFGGSTNSANLTLAGKVTVTGSDTITVNANTLAFSSATTLNGASLTATGTGNLFLSGGLAALGTGNTVGSTMTTGTFNVGTITVSNGATIDFSTAGSPVYTTGTNGSGNSTIISVLDTVNNGADFAAVGTGGAIVAANTHAAEVALPASGLSSSTVYFLNGSQTLSTSGTVAALRINDTSTTDSLNLGSNNLSLGGGGASGLLYNGGANGQYLISGTGFLTGGTGHSMFINTYSGTLTISAKMLDGAGNTFDMLNKGGAGTLILTGNNAFGGVSGGITLGAGTLDLGNGNTGSYTGTGTISIVSGGGGVLGIGLANGSTLAGTFSNNGTMMGIESAGVTNTISGQIGTGFNVSSGGFIQNGAGTTTLTGSNYFTGAVVINAGAIELGNANALGSTSNYTSGVTVNSGGALQLENSITVTATTTLTLSGTGVTGTGNGALENVSGTNTYAGAVSLATAASIGADSGSTLALTGPLTGGGNILSVVGAGNTTFSGAVSGVGGANVTSSGTTTFSGVMSGAGGLTMNNASGLTTLTGSNANTFTGQTVVSAGELDLNKGENIVAIAGAGADNISTPDILVSGGTLKFLADGQVGNVTLSLTSGTVNLNGTDQILYAFQNSGGTFSTGVNGELQGTGATIAFSGGTNTVNSGGVIEDAHFAISGGTNTIQGGGELELDPSGAGIVFSNGANLTLNSDNSNPGQLALNPVGGTFAISSTAAATTASITSGSGGSKAGTINLYGNALTFNIAAGTVPNGGADLAVSAVITDVSGGGSVAKAGAGTLQLSGANTYTGGTTVTAGKLLISNTSGSATGSGSLTVGSSGAISGTGTSTSSSFNISGSVIAGSGGASDFTGVTTLKGAAVLNNSSFANATLSFNLNQSGVTSTSVNVGSTGVNFAGATLSLTLNNSASGNNAYVLIAGVNSSSLAGVDGSQYTGFTTDGSGADGLLMGQYLITSGISLAGAGSGSYLFLNTVGGVDDIEVMVVPEPSTWAMMLGGLALLVLFQRRGRKNGVD